jgi:hypothetical protein
MTRLPVPEALSSFTPIARGNQKDGNWIIGARDQRGLLYYVVTA